MAVINTMFLRPRWTSDIISPVPGTSKSQPTCAQHPGPALHMLMHNLLTCRVRVLCGARKKASSPNSIGTEDMMHTGTGHAELRQGRAAELVTHTVQVPQVLHTKAAVGDTGS